MMTYHLAELLQIPVDQAEMILDDWGRQQQEQLLLNKRLLLPGLGTFSLQGYGVGFQSAPTFAELLSA